MSVLDVDGLVVAYGHAVALHGVSFTIEPGEAIAVVGPNGAGKTSLMRAVSRLVKPRSGAIRFDGADIARTRPSKLTRAGLALVPEGRGVLAPLTVKENLVLGGYHLASDEVQSRTEQMCELFPALERRLETPSGLLSGGEQQMLAIARALMSQPKLLALDEPSMGLAPRIVDQILETLLQIATDGTSILLAEQNAALAADIADRVLVLVHGELVATGESDSLGEDLFERYLA